MKKALALALVMVAGLSALDRSLEEKNDFIPVMAANFADINLDTMESNTSTIKILMGKKSYRSFTDTIGVASLWCKDSTGTDTGAVVLKWQGNTRPDGLATWENIDSTEANGYTSTYVVSRKVVVNSNAYQALRFTIRNKLGTSVGRKGTCQHVGLATRQRGSF